MSPNRAFDEYIGGRVSNLAAYAPEPLEILAERLRLPVEQLIKLDANENPYGPTHHTAEVMSGYSGYQFYPDPLSRRLREGLSTYLGLDSERILVGNGSDELIDLTLRLFRPENGVGGIVEVISCPPTFSMYGHYAHTNDLVFTEVSRLPDFMVDIDAIEALCQGGAQPRILFLASPNNPDGQLVPEEVLHRLLALPLLVILDEAYVEFSTGSYTSLVNTHHNLIVLRTFSKWAGLAGLRVGYGIFPSEFMPALWRIKSPYNVNGLAQAAATATLEDLAAARETVRKITSERDRLTVKLGTLRFLKVYKSQANYVLCQLSGVPVNRLRQAMEAHGIILRYYKESPLENAVRITIGTASQNEAVLSVLNTLEVQEGI
jgi:histidinol-phosphate aminotransferase